MEDVKVYRKEWVRNEVTDEVDIVPVELNWKQLFAEMVMLTIDKDYFPYLNEFKWPEEFYDEEGFNYDKAWAFVYSKMNEVFNVNFEYAYED